LNQAYGVVLGLYGANALGVVRSLGAEGIPVAGFHQGNRFPHAKYSKFTKESYVVTESGNLLDCLLDFGKKNRTKSVLFPTDDKYVLFCQNNYEQLKTHFYVPMSGKGNLNDFLNKNKILELGETAGFSVPKSGHLSNLQEKLTGKVLIKPLNSINAGKDDFFLFNSLKELYEKKQELLDKYGEMVYQQYIEGGVKDHVEVHTYKDKHDVIHMSMLQKIYASENASAATKGSTGAIAKTIWIDELKKPSENLTKDLDFTGPLDINLKKDSLTEKYYFFEVNFRTSANISLDTCAGLNLPFLMYEDVLGNLNKQNPVVAKTNIYWGMENRIVSVLNSMPLEEMSEFRDSLNKIDVYAFFSVKDLLPFVKAADSLNLKSK
jgi:predicted ATP-grasp superfamily ATP-dependent carboligase